MFIFFRNVHRLYSNFTWLYIYYSYIIHSPTVFSLNDWINNYLKLILLKILYSPDHTLKLNSSILLTFYKNHFIWPNICPYIMLIVKEKKHKNDILLFFFLFLTKKGTRLSVCQMSESLTWFLQGGNFTYSIKYIIFH